MLAPGRTLREARPGIDSALPPGDEGAAYDRRAATYDRVIGSGLYNRVFWRTDAAAYTAFAQEALASADGPYLDVGCGSAVFTAPAYRQARRDLVLSDRSLDMLERAAQRLEGAPATLVQADIHDLPFAPGHFATVACFAMLHVLDDPWAALAALADQVAPDGRVFASMLVADGAAHSRTYLKLLQRAGEVGPPRTIAELTAAASDVFGDRPVDVRRTGSMAWLRV